MGLTDLREMGGEVGTTPPEEKDKELGPPYAREAVDGWMDGWWHQWPKLSTHEACWVASQSVDQ